MNEAEQIHRKRGSSAGYAAVAKQLLAEMTRIEEQMDADRAESARLTAEARAIKAETEIIKARTATTLSQLLQVTNSLAEMR